MWLNPNHANPNGENNNNFSLLFHTLPQGGTQWNLEEKSPPKFFNFSFLNNKQESYMKLCQLFEYNFVS